MFELADLSEKAVKRGRIMLTRCLAFVPNVKVYFNPYILRMKSYLSSRPKSGQISQKLTKYYPKWRLKTPLYSVVKSISGQSRPISKQNV